MIYMHELISDLRGINKDMVQKGIEESLYNF